MCLKALNRFNFHVIEFNEVLKIDIFRYYAWPSGVVNLDQNQTYLLLSREFLLSVPSPANFRQR